MRNEGCCVDFFLSLFSWFSVLCYVLGRYHPDTPSSGTRRRTICGCLTSLVYLWTFPCSSCLASFFPKAWLLLMIGKRLWQSRLFFFFLKSRPFKEGESLCVCAPIKRYAYASACYLKALWGLRPCCGALLQSTQRG